MRGLTIFHQIFYGLSVDLAINADSVAPLIRKIANIGRVWDDL